ncbi:MAG: mitochondrial fission ELM1 family protein, partial [Rudaea sp.]|nr:mitochondrial fission ELM1 family protein [Rudaea sp.]
MAITDGAAGNERQALSLALAMRVSPRVLRIALRAPWRWIGPGFTRGARLSILRWQWQTLSAPWPALAIGCGRHAAVITRALREASGGATYAVQILDPRVDPAHFDLVVAPRHDGLEGDNVIQTIGSLNPVDDTWLADAKVEFSTLQQLPQPRTALLVGGRRPGLNVDDAWFGALLARLE